MIGDKDAKLDAQIYRHSIKKWSPSQPYATLPFPKPVPKTHGVHVATLNLAAHHTRNLELYTRFCYLSARSLGMPTDRPFGLPKKKLLISVIKSPFVFKKWQENFERMTYKKSIKVYDANPETIDLWLRYIKKNAIGGVGMRARINEWVDLGFGRKEIEELEGQFADINVDSQSAFKSTVARLVKDLAGPESSDAQKEFLSTRAISGTEPGASSIEAPKASDQETRSAQETTVMADMPQKPSPATTADVERQPKLESTPTAQPDLGTEVADPSSSTLETTEGENAALENVISKEARDGQVLLTTEDLAEISASTAEITSSEAAAEKTPVEVNMAPESENIESVEERSRGETEAATSEALPDSSTQSQQEGEEKTIGEEEPNEEIVGETKETASEDGEAPKKRHRRTKAEMEIARAEAAKEKEEAARIKEEAAKAKEEAKIEAARVKEETKAEAARIKAEEKAEADRLKAEEKAAAKAKAEEKAAKMKDSDIK